MTPRARFSPGSRKGRRRLRRWRRSRGYVDCYGLPRALYVDRDSIYRCDREATMAENLAGKEPTTQFGRAMEELDVEVIMAHSPQAKGRVERVNGTLQDRLVKALRREKISDLPTRRTGSCRRSSCRRSTAGLCGRRREPATFTAACRGGWIWDVCFRSVRRGWCRTTGRCDSRTAGSSWRETHQKLALAGRPVTVSQRLDGRLELLYGGRELSYRELPASPQRQQAEGVSEIRSNQGQRPAADHPWRRGLPGARRRRGRAGPASLRLAALASATPAPP